MKKFLAIFAILILTPSVGLISQETNIDDFNYETEEVKTESQGYFSIGAAYTATFKFFDFGDVNSINKQFGFDDFKSPMLSNGFEIKTGTVLFKNINIGFFSYSGLINKSIDTIITGNNYKKNTNFKTENLGFLFEYSLVPTKSLAISPGFQIGIGNIEMEYSQSPHKINFNDIKNQPLQSSYSNIFRKSFLNFEPKIGVEYAITTFLMFRVLASYNISLDNPISGGKWLYNGSSEIANFPEKINMQHFNLQLGIFVGLMNF